MIGRIWTGWRVFAAGRPGLRFRERYRLRRRRGHRGFHPVRLAYPAGGVALIVPRALLRWLPVLGWGTALLGLGMTAGEFYPTARLMDRLEVWARRVLWPLGRRFGVLPAWAQLSVSLTIAVATFAPVRGLFSLAFGG